MKCPVHAEGECGCPQFVLRLVLGVIFFVHGSQKVLGWFGGYGLGPTIQMFTQMMHIPLIFAWLAIAAEFLGGLGLIFGFLTRLAAAGIGIEMAVAVAMIHHKNGFFMNWSGKQPGEGYEYHLLVIAICLALIMMGAGAWSIDGCMCKKKTS